MLQSALVFVLRLVCSRTSRKTTRPTQPTLDDNRRTQFRSKLSTGLSYETKYPETERTFGAIQRNPAPSGDLNAGLQPM